MTKLEHKIMKLREKGSMIPDERLAYEIMRDQCPEDYYCKNCSNDSEGVPFAQCTKCWMEEYQEKLYNG